MKNKRLISVLSLLIGVGVVLPAWAQNAANIPAKKPINAAMFGLNLGGYADWDPIVPFNDLMKQARPWVYGFKKDDPKPQIDDLGNWKPEIGKNPICILALPEAKCPAGIYIVKWSGKGKIGLAQFARGGKIAKEAANRLEIEFTENPTIALSILESDASDPVRSVQCFLPNTENAPSQFRVGYYLPHHPKFSVYRFMDWQHTNGSKQEKWSSRPVPEQQTFRLEERNGVPLEWMIDFANLNDAAPWLCIPHKADDEYIRNFAQMVKTRLKPGLKAYIEYSNEIWNTAYGFSQTQWSIEQSKTLPQPIPSPNVPIASWYSKRSQDVFKIFDEVYGGREAASKRYVRVAAGFFAIPYISKLKLQAYDLNKNSDVFAIAPYGGFNRDIRTGEFDPAKFTPQQLADQVPGQIDGFLTDTLRQNVAVAKEMNLPIITYEAGIVLANPPKSTDPNAAEKLVVEAARQPSMEPSMEKYLRRWFEQSGNGLMMLFSDYTRLSRWGTYDNLGEYPGQPDAEAHKRRAILRLLDDPKLIEAGRPNQSQTTQLK